MGSDDDIKGAAAVISVLSCLMVMVWIVLGGAIVFGLVEFGLWLARQ